MSNNKSINKKTGRISEFSSEDRALLKSFDDDYINNLIVKARKKDLTINTDNKKKSNNAPEQFKEAILISALVRELSSSSYPLGRKRYQKNAYLALRKAEYHVTHKFSKKAAGPYDHTMRYKGAEGIALNNRYIKRGKKGEYTGFLPGDNISAIDQYLIRYNFSDSINWVVEQFRKTRNDELELLATVDYASLELVSFGKVVTATEVRNLIANEPEWLPKLERDIFSIKNIQRALSKLKSYFPEDY